MNTGSAVFTPGGKVASRLDESDSRNLLEEINVFAPHRKELDNFSDKNDESEDAKKAVHINESARGLLKIDPILEKSIGIGANPAPGF